MTDYSLITNYQREPRLRQSFFDLAKRTFDIDFTPWYQAGAWDANYRCYSYVYDGQIIANVSVNLMTVQLAGHKRLAVQLGTVMTHPNYRRQGLAKQLMAHVIEQYENETAFMYLFANQDALDFYPQFGFQRQAESQLTISVAGQLQPSAKTYRHLSVDDATDLALLREFADRRLPNSECLGISHNPSLLLFYFIVVFPDCLFYFEDRGTVVIAQQQGSTLDVFDIVQLSPSALSPLLSQLIDERTDTLQLHFLTDSLEFQIDQRELKTPEDYLFVRPLVDTLPPTLLFPLTSHA